jgi:hypothetical protein
MAILDCSSSLNGNEHGKASDRWALWCIAVANFASDRDQNAAGSNNKVMAKRGLLSGDRIGRRAKSIGANPLSHRTTSKVLSIQFVEAYPCGGTYTTGYVNRATRLGRHIHQFDGQSATTSAIQMARALDWILLTVLARSPRNGRGGWPLRVMSSFVPCRFSAASKVDS